MASTRRQKKAKLATSPTFPSLPPIRITVDNLFLDQRRGTGNEIITNGNETAGALTTVLPMDVEHVTDRFFMSQTDNRTPTPFKGWLYIFRLFMAEAGLRTLFFRRLTGEAWGNLVAALFLRTEWTCTGCNLFLCGEVPVVSCRALRVGLMTNHNDRLEIKVPPCDPNTSTVVCTRGAVPFLHSSDSQGNQHDNKLRPLWDWLMKVSMQFFLVEDCRFDEIAPAIHMMRIAPTIEAVMGEHCALLQQEVTLLEEEQRWRKLIKRLQLAAEPEAVQVARRRYNGAKKATRPWSCLSTKSPPGINADFSEKYKAICAGVTESKCALDAAIKATKAENVQKKERNTASEGSREQGATRVEKQDRLEKRKRKRDTKDGTHNVNAIDAAKATLDTTVNALKEVRILLSAQQTVLEGYWLKIVKKFPDTTPQYVSPKELGLPSHVKTPLGFMISTEPACTAVNTSTIIHAPIMSMPLLSVIGNHKRSLEIGENYEPWRTCWAEMARNPLPFLATLSSVDIAKAAYLRDCSDSSKQVWQMIIAPTVHYGAEWCARYDTDPRICCSGARKSAHYSVRSVSVVAWRGTPSRRFPTPNTAAISHEQQQRDYTRNGAYDRTFKHMVDRYQIYCAPAPLSLCLRNIFNMMEASLMNDESLESGANPKKGLVTYGEYSYGMGYRFISPNITQPTQVHLQDANGVKLVLNLPAFHMHFFVRDGISYVSVFSMLYGQKPMQKVARWQRQLILVIDREGCAYPTAKFTEVSGPVGTQNTWIPGTGDIETTLQLLDQNTRVTTKILGRLSGMCCWCGEPLTSQESLDNGFGPVCAKRYNLVE